MSAEKMTLQNIKGVGDKISEKIINSVGGEEELQKIVDNVDVEKIAPVRTASFADKALSISEKQEYCSLPDSEKEEYLIRKWSEKESLFKLSGEKTFHPSEIDTLCERVHSRIIENEGERFVLSVAGGTESIKISRIKSIE